MKNTHAAAAAAVTGTIGGACMYPYKRSITLYQAEGFNQTAASTARPFTGVVDVLRHQSNELGLAAHWRGFGVYSFRKLLVTPLFLTPMQLVSREWLVAPLVPKVRKSDPRLYKMAVGLCSHGWHCH